MPVLLKVKNTMIISTLQQQLTTAIFPVTTNMSMRKSHVRLSGICPIPEKLLSLVVPVHFWH